MPDDVVDPSPIAGPDALTQTDIISRRPFLILWRVPQDTHALYTKWPLEGATGNCCIVSWVGIFCLN